MILIVASKFDKSGGDVIQHLLDGAIKKFSEVGMGYKIVRVPGANEIPVTIQCFLKKEKFLAVLALGCVIKGDTDHYELVIKSATEGMTHLAIQTGIPIIQGILACQNPDQALARTHLGAEYANTTLEMIDLLN